MSISSAPGEDPPHVRVEDEYSRSNVHSAETSTETVPSGPGSLLPCDSGRHDAKQGVRLKGQNFENEN